MYLNGEKRPLKWMALKWMHLYLYFHNALSCSLEFEDLLLDAFFLFLKLSMTAVSRLYDSRETLFPISVF